MKFGIEWASGSREVDVAECINPDAYAMQRWGLDTAAAVKDAYGISIVLLEDDHPVTPRISDQPVFTPEQLKTQQIQENKAIIKAGA
jgi:hypothetical protein